MKKHFLFLSMALLLASIGTAFAQDTVSVNLKMDKEIGVIRNINGGQLSPVSWSRLLDISLEFKELSIPIVRLHDASIMNDNVVDIHTIFPLFRLDPNNPDNYDFRQTDTYLAKLFEAGTQVVFRLGESIEHSEIKYYVNPPEDNVKWAAICRGIIRHYNEGWANGFHHNIKYWEIWNEPDGSPATWNGTPEQFFKLYGVAATAIKKEFPTIMIGGPGMALPLGLTENTGVASDFTKNFLTYCKKQSVPLDFFSWHNYNTSPWDLTHRATTIRSILNEYGFTKTESHLNEWNYIPDWKWGNLFMGGLGSGKIRTAAYARQQGCEGAAFLADALILLQDEPIDVANFYTTTFGLFGIFSIHGEPLKNYYAFKAFAELLKTPVRIATEYNKSDSLVVCSGTTLEHDQLNILTSNFSFGNKKVDFKLNNSFLKGALKLEVYIIDETHNLSKIKEYVFENSTKLIQFSEEILPFSVVLIKIFPN